MECMHNAEIVSIYPNLRTIKQIYITFRTRGFFSKSCGANLILELSAQNNMYAKLKSNLTEFLKNTTLVQ
jgi:hypothetical protein